MANFFNLKSFQCDANKVLKSRGLEEGGRVQKYIDTECLRLTNEKMPKRDNILISSGINNTVIGNGEIRYMTPYARRLYYHPEYNFSQAPERGAYAFERIKQQYKEQILSGAKRVSGGK